MTHLFIIFMEVDVRQIPYSYGILRSSTVKYCYVGIQIILNFISKRKIVFLQSKKKLLQHFLYKSRL